MSPGDFLANLVSLPELELRFVAVPQRANWVILTLESVSKWRACPRCTTLSSTTYDHRTVKVLDAPFRDKRVQLRIRKKRYSCRHCRKPFTELVYGIFKGARLTERLRRTILWSCSRFQSLKEVGLAMGCSDSTVRRSFYAHLKIHVGRHLNYGFPKMIGIDEHFFGLTTSPRYSAVCEQKYHTTIVDLKAHRLYRALKDKDAATLFDQLKNEYGHTQVEDAVMDMSEANRNLVRALFPNARITVDKFHVLRLPIKALNHERKKLLGRKKKKNPISSLLLKSAHDLDYATRSDISRTLAPHAHLKALYEFKERLHTLYRCRGRKRAEISMQHLIKDLENYHHFQPLRALRKTLIAWQDEILNYFDSHLTNAMTEGFNNKIKLIKRMAYGFRNQDFYDLRILYACYH
jgi:transposase